MKLGHIQQIGSPIEIYNKPANVFVAGFIGSPSMNLMKATYENGCVILGNGKKIKCPEEWVKAHEAFYKAEIEADKAAMSKIQSESEITKDEAAASRLQQAEAKLKADEAALENAHEIIFGIRPEDIHEGDEEHVKRYGGEPYDISVAVAELLGHEYYVHSDFAGGDLVAKIPLTHEIKIGDQMKILFDVPKAHIFDKATEKRIH